MTLPTALRQQFLECDRRFYTRLRALADSRLAARSSRQNKRPKPSHLITGERGEDAAFFHLRSLGYTIVARRWRSDRHPGDLDLVAWSASTLVIVEVKARTARDFLPAESAVGPHKQRMLRRMAAAYIAQLPEPHRHAVNLRFDVLAVYLLPTGTEFEHLPNAFERDEPQRRSRF